MQTEMIEQKEYKLIEVPSYFGLFYIASTITEYPNKERFRSSLETLRELQLNEAAVSLESSSWNVIKKFLENEQQDYRTLCAEYIRLFDTGKSSNPLYESEYGRSRMLAKGSEMADIAGFYKAFGFELEKADMYDHISLELEFYFHILLKQAYLLEQGKEEGVQVISDARVQFMQAHLGRLPKAILERSGVHESEFYKAVFSWVSALVELECNTLGVIPKKLEWVDEKPLDLSCCGSL